MVSPCESLAQSPVADKLPQDTLTLSNVPLRTLRLSSDILYRSTDGFIDHVVQARAVIGVDAHVHGLVRSTRLAICSAARSANAINMKVELLPPPERNVDVLTTYRLSIRKS
jgi:hypothetical protein